jgi:peptidoglycan/LPS O-acetylase OafA/YrhL
LSIDGNKTIHPVNFSSKSHSTEIDSLRAVAALLVFFYHAITVMIKPVPAFPDTNSGFFVSFFFAGFTGVTLFFVISSFLLTIPFLLDPHASRTRFFKKRLLRILPLYFVIVAIAGLVTKTAITNPGEVIRSFLFFFEAWSLFPFSVPWWSLRTEMEFYILLGLLLPLIHFRRGIAVVLISLALILLGRYIILLQTHLLFSNTFLFELLFQSAIVYAPTFLIGIAASFVYVRYSISIRNFVIKSRILNSIAADLIFFLLLAALAVVLSRVAAMNPVVAQISWPQHYSYEALLWSLLLLCVILLPLRIKPLIANKMMARFGETTYSFYLIHLPLMHYVNVNFLPVESGFTVVYWGKVILILVLAMILSFLSYRFIEKPFLRIKDSF